MKNKPYTLFRLSDLLRNKMVLFLETLKEECANANDESDHVLHDGRLRRIDPFDCYKVFVKELKKKNFIG